MIQNGDQEVLVELKGIGELLCHLPDTVYELKEDRSSLIVTVVLVTMTDTLYSQEKIEILSRNWKHSTMQVLKLIYLLELVAERYPLLLYQNLYIHTNIQSAIVKSTLVP